MWPSVNAGRGPCGRPHRMNMATYKDKYTWVPFFHELAEKLLTYKDRQEQLRTLVLKSLDPSFTK